MLFLRVSRPFEGPREMCRQLCDVAIWSVTLQFSSLLVSPGQAFYLH